MGTEELGHGMTAAQVVARQFNADSQLERVCGILQAALVWWEDNRPQTGPGTLPTWVVDARSALGRKPR